MNNLNELLALTKSGLLQVFIVVLLLKIILFFIYEREWNSIAFLHFSKVELKMTASKDLRDRRSRQNILTKIILILLLLLLITSMFHLLVQD